MRQRIVSKDEMKRTAVLHQHKPLFCACRHIDSVTLRRQSYREQLPYVVIVFDNENVGRWI